MVSDAALLLDYPRDGVDDAEQALATLRMRVGDGRAIAAVIIEPIQGRGGCVVPPRGYLEGLRRFCDERGILLIFDEIYTGFGRTGDWFACEHEGVTPDIICIGKAMGAGFPISAAVAREEVMNAWPLSAGEALHTSTYLGNPMGCAAALATIDELQQSGAYQRARELGEELGGRLASMQQRKDAVAARGRGLMWGLQLRNAEHAERTVKRALLKGVIMLQAGPAGDVLSITPPLVVSKRQLHRALDILEEVL